MPKLRIEAKVRIFDLPAGKRMYFSGEWIVPGEEQVILETEPEEIHIFGGKRTTFIPYTIGKRKRYLMKTDIQSNMDQRPTRQGRNHGRLTETVHP